MPNVLDIRRRIRSVRNTQQITKAMKMVSAAKLRRAQVAVLRARPYAGRILEVVRSLMARSEIQRHPLLEEREEQNHSVGGGHRRQGAVRRLQRQHRQVGGRDLSVRTGSKSIDLFCVGRKGRDYFGKRTTPIRHQLVNLFQRIEYRPLPGDHRQTGFPIPVRGTRRRLPALQRVQVGHPAADRSRAAAAHSADRCLLPSRPRSTTFTSSPRPRSSTP